MQKIIDTIKESVHALFNSAKINLFSITKAYANISTAYYLENKRKKDTLNFMEYCNYKER